MSNVTHVGPNALSIRHYDETIYELKSVNDASKLTESYLGFEVSDVYVLFRFRLL